MEEEWCLCVCVGGVVMERGGEEGEDFSLSPSQCTNTLGLS